MSKFGIQIKDEVTLTISRERYENHIALIPELQDVILDGDS